MCHLITEPRWKWRPSSSQKVWDLSLAGGVAEMLSLKLQLKLIITQVSRVKSKCYILPKRENVCNTGFQMLTNDFVKFVNFIVCGLSFKCWELSKSHLSKLLNKLYTPTNGLFGWEMNVWIIHLAKLYCLVQKCVENLEHDFEFLCKKWLLHGQLKLNCIKRDKVMQWKVRFKTSLFTSPKRLYLKNMNFFSSIWCSEYRLLST